MLEFMVKGGPIMWVLLGLSIAALAVALDRWRIFREAATDADALRKSVLKGLSEDRLDDAVAACTSRKGPVAAVLLAGLNRYRRLVLLGRVDENIDESVAKSMEDYAPRVVGVLEKRVNVLMMIGSVSPLLGMTGTVLGMIKAFDEMSREGLGGDAVAAGISEALITTAAGLLLAVPAVVLYNLFSNKVEQYIRAIEESAGDLVEFIHLNRPTSRTL